MYRLGSMGKGLNLFQHTLHLRIQTGYLIVYIKLVIDEDCTFLYEKHLAKTVNNETIDFFAQSDTTIYYLLDAKWLHRWGKAKSF